VECRRVGDRILLPISHHADTFREHAAVERAVSLYWEEGDAERSLRLLLVHPETKGDDEEAPVARGSATAGDPRISLGDLQKEILCTLSSTRVPLDMLARDVRAEREAVIEALMTVPPRYRVQREPLRDQVWLDSQTWAIVNHDLGDWYAETH
jgi:hypothetical protein